MSLEENIKRQIRENGPMDVATFMGIALLHYYGTRDPLGRGGDFTTAPEISQMFGELIGAWLADCWMQLGAPKECLLVECGPGRGTLMADALRATKSAAGFHEAVKICLVEQSESLKQKQREALAGYDVQWFGHIADLPQGVPILLAANEFFDALPVRQYQMENGAWHERVIGFGEDDNLQFGLIPAAAAPDIAAKDGEIAETSPVQIAVMEQIAARIHKDGGAAIIIDYGYTEGHGDSLQAAKDHQYCGVLEHIGEADLTTHVDFAALAAAAKEAKICGPVAQGKFLQALGVSQRAAMLKQAADAQQAEQIDAALKRLIAPDEMGELFKVMGVCSDGIIPAGF